MSYTTLYSIDRDGFLEQDSVLRNSHGGQPLIWDLLEPTFDPPTEAWKRENRFMADDDGNFRSRWMFDLGPKRDGKGGSLDRSYQAIARTDLPEAQRIAFAATDHRTWIAAGNCERVAAALDEVSKLVQRVNHLPAIAEFLRRAVPEGWLGVRIRWSSLNEDIAHRTAEDDEDGGEVESPNFAAAPGDKLHPQTFGIFELFEMAQLADLRPPAGAA